MTYEKAEFNGTKYIILKDKVYVNFMGFTTHLPEMNDEDYLQTISKFLKIPLEELQEEGQFIGKSYFNKMR